MSSLVYVFSRFRTASLVLSALVRDKRGLTGLLILVIYGVIGGVGPYLLPYDPILSQNLADANAMPEWMASPDIPRTMTFSLDNWTVVDISREGSVNISIENMGRVVVIRVYGEGTANISLVTRDTINYTYRPAKSLRVYTTYSVVPLRQEGVKTGNTTGAWYSISFYLVNIDLLGRNTTIQTGGRNYTIPMGLYVFYSDPGFRFGYIYQYTNDIVVNRTADQRLPSYVINPRQPYPMPEAVNPVSEILLDKNTRLGAGVNITYYCDPSSFLMRCERGSGIEVVVRRVHVTIYGLAFGLLGTNDMGSDVWTQFVYGARTAIIFGFSVAIAIIVIGLFVGVFAGYYAGRLRDYVVTFVTDVVYFLPVLPLVMAAGIVFGRSIYIIL